MKITKILMLLCLSLSIAQAKESAVNFTKASELQNTKIIQDGAYKFGLIPEKNVVVRNGRKVSVTDNILVNYPIGLVNQGVMFGGVVIKVSDKENEVLGNLKLSHVTATVQTRLINTTEKQALALVGHYWEGVENEAPSTIVEIPALTVDKSSLQLDLSSLGEKLDVSYYLGKFGGEDVAAFKHIDSKTTAVDFSFSTLVWDVESNFEYSQKDSKGEVKTSNITLTTRWFMRLNSANSPFFIPRKNVEGVGYFTAGLYNPEGGKVDYINRFAIHDLKNNPVKFYVKNVPKEELPAILSGFEDWNHKLEPILGHDLLTYEVLEKNDPRYDQIVPGDVRFNVLEWDLENKASYGGLGPTLKNSSTGEVMAAQTLIQGPTILEIYKSWFKVKEEAARLRRAQKLNLAEELEKNFLKKQFNRFNVFNNRGKVSIAFSDAKMYVPAQDPRLFDAVVVNPLDFQKIPDGYTYETYMNGYWREIVAHELGHNLGLRHNFRGNLKDTGDGKVSSVSWSVMEYLPRTHRHLNRVSEYDVMAIAYGYLGILPEHKDRFCTDENQGVFHPMNSAECSNGDATNDPVSFLESRINRGLDLLLARGTSLTPEWTIAEAWGPMSGFFRHLTAYATTAQATAHTWTNFFGKPGRPQNPLLVPQYIISRLNYLVCGAHLDKEVDNKSTDEAKIKVQENLKAYRAQAFDTIKKVPTVFPIVNKQNFTCLTE